MTQRATIICYCKKQIDISFSSVCLVIDNEFRYNKQQRYHIQWLEKKEFVNIMGGSLRF